MWHEINKKPGSRYLINLDEVCEIRVNGNVVTISYTNGHHLTIEDDHQQSLYTELISLLQGIDKG